MNANIKKGLVAVGVIAGALIIPEAAFAIDVSSAETMINTDATDAVTTIGEAMMGLAGLAIAFKWAKASIFG
jgi:hypothetical protein